jgi:signal transduction histidine kinase
VSSAVSGDAERAAADATLVAILRRMASPLRHDLAGALLVPRMRLQMLRRQMQGNAPDAQRLLGSVDDALSALDALRTVQIATAGWLEQRDDAPLRLGDALSAGVSSFGLPFSERGIPIEQRSGDAIGSACYTAQPLKLLLQAGFLLALDQAPPSGRLVVDCAADGQGARVQWRFEANDRGGATALAAGCSVPDRDRLTPAGVAALCRRFAARFEPDPAVGTLHLAASSALPSAT